MKCLVHLLYSGSSQLCCWFNSTFPPSFWSHLRYYNIVILCIFSKYQFTSVQSSRSVMSDALWPHELQHARPPCPSPTPKVHSDSRPSSEWCHPVISSSVVPFSSCPQFLPAWGGQSTGVSASASFPPKKSQGWSPSERPTTRYFFWQIIHKCLTELSYVQNILMSSMGLFENSEQQQHL